MPQITGQLLFEALETGKWADLSSDRQSHYNTIAGKLNQQYLIPLHRLVRGWRTWAQELEMASVTDVEAWMNAYEGLQQRTTLLLGEEQKG